MSKITVGIVDYGVGNHASVRHALNDLGWRCRTSDQASVLDACDMLVLPGVGAFRPAIEAMPGSESRSLFSRAGRAQSSVARHLSRYAIIGADSHEDGETHGLGLVPGEVVGLPPPHWHIGWNTIEQVQTDPLFLDSNGHAFYFNHSYAYRGPIEYQVCRSIAGEEFASVIRRNQIVGVQFHPEKSQAAGRALLRTLISGLCDA